MLPGRWADDNPSGRREYIANNGRPASVSTGDMYLGTEDVGCWKLAAQYVQRELKEADEVNLLDEEVRLNGMLPGRWADDNPSGRREYIANNGRPASVSTGDMYLGTEDVGCWKLAAQYVQRELKEADEVNLLDEEVPSEFRASHQILYTLHGKYFVDQMNSWRGIVDGWHRDMHVFGLRPMMDPLILVRLQTSLLLLYALFENYLGILFLFCFKHLPVPSLTSCYCDRAKGLLVCCNSCKKPVKASQYATHADICKSLSSVVDNTTEVDVVGGQKKPPRKERKKLQICISTQVPSVGKPERSALSNTAASNSNLDEQTLKATSFPIQVKVSANVKNMVNVFISSFAANSYCSGRDFTNESQARSLKIFDSVTSLQKPRKLEDHHLQTKGMSTVPAPLATKIFYSQRTQRLRSAISHMYYRSSTQHDQGLSNMQFSDSNKMTPWTSAHSYSYPEKIDGQHEKLGNQVPCMVENRDPVPAKSSEAISDESRTILPKKLTAARTMMQQRRLLYSNQEIFW
ncbi:hypothetical protein Ccrd_006560 [Cynara cardunculus var. scolymus]|uniref:Uncharacterized protein n=1 Tax=Cynara cardunculus var. scolymus TaxID=59895 RepID=A0A103XIJ9_CYNCS|nr:hypothetical protein Ccrd_006560 [Cynara cardunculus var. scolymus]